MIYKVEGGSPVASVSNNFKIQGSLRTFSTLSYEILKNKITNLATNLCLSYGAKAKIEFIESIFLQI